MVTRVIIMRGVSGSGKSTYVKNNHPTAIVCSSDDFWTQPSIFPESTSYIGNFNIKRLGEAHAWNLKNYVMLVSGQVLADAPIEVVVDNTNTSIPEVAPYYQVAVAFGVPVEIITLDTDPDVAFARNTHGVPRMRHEQQVRNLRKNNDSFPSYWKHTVIKG
jgi:predicted kinase